MPNQNPISSAELGTLWLTYQEKTMILRMLDYFIKKTDDSKATHIMKNLRHGIHPFVIEIELFLKRKV